MMQRAPVFVPNRERKSGISFRSRCRSRLDIRRETRFRNSGQCSERHSGPRLRISLKQDLVPIDEANVSAYSVLIHVLTSLIDLLFFSDSESRKTPQPDPFETFSSRGKFLNRVSEQERKKISAKSEIVAERKIQRKKWLTKWCAMWTCLLMALISRATASAISEMKREEMITECGKHWELRKGNDKELRLVANYAAHVASQVGSRWGQWQQSILTTRFRGTFLARKSSR